MNTKYLLAVSAIVTSLTLELVEILIQIMNMLTTKINNKKKAKLKLIIQKLSGTFKSKNGEGRRYSKIDA